MAEQRTTPGSTVALTIAGSDSCGGAGIQADLKTFTVMNVFGSTAITAVTAQNSKGVDASYVLDAKLVEQQIDAVASDFNIKATKTGMLGSAANVEAIVDAIDRSNLFPLVVDPVMVAKSGAELVDEDTIKAMVKQLLSKATIVTPNRHEAAKILGQGQPIKDVSAGPGVARQVCEATGAAACLLKGFKRENEEEGEAVDFFYDGEEAQEIVSDWRPTENTHGSGCVLAAAITAGLALGAELSEAVKTAKAVVAESIRQATDHGGGKGPVNPLAYMSVKK